MASACVSPPSGALSCNLCVFLASSYTQYKSLCLLHSWMQVSFVNVIITCCCRSTHVSASAHTPWMPFPVLLLSGRAMFTFSTLPYSSELCMLSIASAASSLRRSRQSHCVRASSLLRLCGVATDLLIQEVHEAEAAILLCNTGRPQQYKRYWVAIEVAYLQYSSSN